MNLSKKMVSSTAQLHHTLNLSILNSTIYTQAAQAILMLNDMAKSNSPSDLILH